MKKHVISLILIIVCALAVFFIGWVEFRVPAGKCGVMVSKTGGVYRRAIRSGHFDWRWECLLPTNVRIRTFKIEPLAFTKTVSGALPSAELYSNLLEGKPDFSYRFSLSLTMNISAESLPAFVKRSGAAEQNELEQYVSGEAENLAHAVAHFVLDTALKNPSSVIAASFSDTELLEHVRSDQRFSKFEIASVHINELHVPDTGLYNIAKSTYETYQEKLKATLEKTGGKQAAQAAADYLELERFSRLGRILSEYPLLIQFLSVSSGKNVTLELPANPQINGNAQNAQSQTGSTNE